MAKRKRRKSKSLGTCTGAARNLKKSKSRGVKSAAGRKLGTCSVSSKKKALNKSTGRLKKGYKYGKNGRVYKVKK